MFKVLAVLGFVAVAYAADLSVGAQGGKLIFDKNITASPAIWKQVLNVTVNSTNPEEVIGGIVVIDNRPEKNGEATVVEGGEGEKNITIELKSPAVFRGFDFSVKVFAREENENARSPNHPTPIGVDTQNPQEPKNINSNQEAKNGGDIIIGAPPTAASSTEANKDDQVPTNPALVGKDQVRQNRDTEDQGTKEQASDDATKDADKPEQPAVVETDSQQKTNDSEKVLPVEPQGKDEVDDDEDVEENSQSRHAHEHKEEEASTAQAESTTVEVSTTEEVTTEGKSEDHHHNHGYHHGVPLPYAN